MNRYRCIELTPIFESAFKAKVALEAIKNEKTLIELAKEFNVPPSKISSWKDELLHNASSVFLKADHSDEKVVTHLKSEKDRVLKKIGELTVENDFFASACEDAGLKIR